MPVVYFSPVEALGSTGDFSIILLSITKSSFTLMTKQTKRIISISPSFFPLPIVRSSLSFSRAWRKIKGPSACVCICVQKRWIHINRGGDWGAVGWSIQGYVFFKRSPSATTCALLPMCARTEASGRDAVIEGPPAGSTQSVWPSALRVMKVNQRLKGELLLKGF